MSMDFNQEKQTAWRIVETTDANLFLTGKAGTGKTTFLRELKEKSPKRMVVLAPTGIAAINAGGVTIHSFFQLPFAPFLPETSFKSGGAAYDFRYNKQRLEVIRTVDLLVIDEISMVRADLLDAIDYVMRKFRDRSRPFGGVQLVMIGDLGQLPPVVKDDDWALLRGSYETPYFFSSNALRATDFFIIELTKVYRQSDARFLDLLNRVRDNRLDAAALALLNSRYVPGFVPPEGQHYIRLTTHNAAARQVNEGELAKLPGDEHTFTAAVTGNFPAYSYPTEEQLVLKVGAQVMFVKNGMVEGIRYCNGMIGRVEDIDGDTVTVSIAETDEVVELGREEWTNAKYVIDRATKAIVEEVEGTFTQLPLKLAWAITIHKSQGLTFEHAVIDAAASFSHGQAYVALSRCKTLEGMVLSTPLNASAVITDTKVDRFMDAARRNTPSEGRLREMKCRFFVRLLDDLFDCTGIRRAVARLSRVVDEHLAKLYPNLAERLRAMAATVADELVSVAARFHNQYAAMALAAHDPETDEAIAARVGSAAAYFADRLAPMCGDAEAMEADTDNKDVRKLFDEALTELRRLMLVKSSLLAQVREGGFTMNGYLRAKSVATLTVAETKLKKKKTPKPATTQPQSSDVAHPDLYARLIAWRNAEAAREGKPVYTVLQQRAIIGIANTLPRTKAELLAVPCFGPKTYDRHGQAILQMVDEYLASDAPAGGRLW